MASLSVLPPRVVQSAFEPVLRPRSPALSLSRLVRPVTPLGLRAASFTSASLSSPVATPALPPTPTQDRSDPFSSSGAALRRRTPRKFHDDDEYYALGSWTSGKPSLALAPLDAFYLPTSKAEVIIPLPAPFTPPTMATAITHRPSVPGPVVRATKPSPLSAPLFFRDVSRNPLRATSAAKFNSRLVDAVLATPTKAQTQLGHLVQPNPPAFRTLPVSQVRIASVDLSPSDPKSARAVPVHLRPTMTIESTSGAHTMYLPLKRYAPDEVTVTVVPSDDASSGPSALRVVVDKWESELDSESEQGYLEYLVQFDSKDGARVGGVHAGFRDGRLQLTIPRTA